jgi:tRNA1(Val) A37 N6-methylase TrmN6
MNLDSNSLTSDAVTGSFRLLQRRRGHRFSVDDLATAWEAARAAPDARSFVDLGCGVGAVLLMVAWRLPTARGLGIEAQDVSFALARRNVDENGLEARVALLHDDLRHAVLDLPPSFELVTGTPPYLPLGTAIASPDPQRAAARIELRGGVEDYLAAAARVLAPGGAVVVCSDGRAPERVVRGARAAHLAPVRRLDIVPRAGARTPLFAVWTCAHIAPPTLEHEVIVLRDERGERTPASTAMRRFFGLA